MRSLEEHPDRQVVNLPRALKRLGGDEAMLRDLIAIFLEELPEWMTRLEVAVAEEDADSLFRVAHDVKGSTDVFGASNAAEAAQTLERMGRTQDLWGADEALGVLKAELVWVRQALQALHRAS